MNCRSSIIHSKDLFCGKQLWIWRLKYYMQKFGYRSSALIKSYKSITRLMIWYRLCWRELTFQCSFQFRPARTYLLWQKSGCLFFCDPAKIRSASGHSNAANRQAGGCLIQGCLSASYTEWFIVQGPIALSLRIIPSYGMNINEGDLVRLLEISIWRRN